MTKKAILELIRERCKEQDSTEQFDILYIQGYCDNVWQSFVMDMNMSKTVDQSFYAKSYDTTILGTAGNYYTSLPETIINLPRVGSGVLSIRTQDTRVYYSPVTEHDFTYIPSQEVGRQAEDIYFYMGYDTVYYGGAMTATEVSAGVTMSLVIPFSKYLMTEELPLPSSKQALFIDSVVERVIGTPAPNLLNKNSDA